MDYFITPVVTGIIILLVAIGSISAAFEEMNDGFFGEIYIKWDYASTIFEENKADSLLRKRKKYIKLQIKNIIKVRMNSMDLIKLQIFMQNRCFLA